MKSKVITKAKEVIKDLKFTKPPINVDAIAKFLKIPVIYEDLPDEISGILYAINKNKIKYSIIVNKNHHSNRQRFSIAHELGHFCLKHSTATHIDKQPLFRDQKSAAAIDPIEIEANTFAAEILMPEDILRKQFIGIDNRNSKDEDEIIRKLSEVFKVSNAAMSYRLQNIGIIA